MKLYKRIKYAGDVHKEMLKLGWGPKTAAVFLNGIPDVPNTEYAPVEHGRWITHNKLDPFLVYGECSNCGYKQAISAYLNYCPGCGTKMDDDGDDQ